MRLRVLVFKGTRVEWPSCPDGHGGSVSPWGFRWRKDKLFARPVFKCDHPRCDESCHRRRRRGDNPCGGVHYFTGPSHARTSVHPLGTWCTECSRERSMREGVPIANEWDFEAGLIADALIEVGSGASYRAAAQAMRVAARRFSIENGVPIVSPWGGSVMRYLDHFGRLVLDEIEHKEWPEVLVLDALPLRKREVTDDDPFAFEQSGSGAILVAVGYTNPITRTHRRKRDDEKSLVSVDSTTRRRPHVWKMTLSGGYNRWAWADFLASLPGTPRWIVVDGEAPVRLGIRLRWGDGPDAPIVYSCEGHLRRKFCNRALTQDKLSGFEVERLWPEWKRTEPPDSQPRGPLHERDSYRRLLDGVLAYPESKVENISSWIRAHDETIRRQFDLRDARRAERYPRGNGAAEAVIEQLGDVLGDRTKVIQNIYRTNIALGLIAAHMGHLDDRAVYQRIVRDELERTNGRPEIDWREHHYAGRVRRGTPAPKGSLFHLADYYQGLGEREQRTYWVDKQASSMEKKLLHHNIYAFLNGYPKLTLTKSKTPAVSLSGLKLRDLPLIRREWDPANSRNPDEIAATHYKQKFDWICFDDPAHRFSSTVLARCARLTGCPECQRVRGAARSRKTTNREALRLIRERWGDFEAVSAEAVPVPAGVPPDERKDEDF